MTRQTLQAAIAAALFASLALAGCKKQAETPAAPASTPDMTPAPTPAPEVMPITVTTVELGNSIDPDNRISAPMTEFAATDTIHASVGTDGGSAGKLGAKWTYQDGQVVDTTDKSVPAGPQVTEFSIAKPDAWPLGSYTLEVQLNGIGVQTRQFVVK